MAIRTSPLREWRKAKGLTQEVIASRVGCTRERICQIETSGLHDPAMAAKVSAATWGEVTVEQLLYPDGLPDGARLSRPKTRRAA